MTVKKILQSRIGAFLIIIPFIKPASEITGAFDIVFDIFKLIAAILIVFGFWSLKKSISKVTLLFFIIQVLYFSSTVVHFGDLKAAIVQMASNISICLYMEYLFWVDKRIALRNFCLPTLSMAVLTSITMFVFHPDGMYSVGDARYMEKSNFLWGFDNASVFLFIPSMFFLIMYSVYVTKKYVKAALLLLFITGSFLYVQSITAFIFCLFITLGYIALFIFKLRIKFFNMRSAVLLILVLMASLLYLKDNFDILMKIAESTGKFYSIKARFIFWEKELEYIAKSPFIGYGVEDKLLLIDKIFIDHPHNYFFDIFYRGGVVAAGTLGCYFYLMVTSRPKITPIKTIIVICFMSLMICSIFDFYNDIYLFYPHLLAVYLCYKSNDNDIEIKKMCED